MRTGSVLTLWSLLTVVGVVLMALPDDNRALVRFSDAHGPALLDSIGAVLVIVGHTLLLRAAWTRRHAARGFGTRPRGAALFLLGLGAGLVIASAASDITWWWALGTAIAATVQYVFVARALWGPDPQPSPAGAADTG